MWCTTDLHPKHSIPKTPNTTLLHRKTLHTPRTQALTYAEQLVQEVGSKDDGIWRQASIGLGFRGFAVLGFGVVWGIRFRMKGFGVEGFGGLEFQCNFRIWGLKVAGVEL